jgi:hypothetical protein
LVNQERVEQGDAAVLEQGSAIRISSYMLYFLVPKDAIPKSHVVVVEPPTPSAPPPPPTAAPKKRRKSLDSVTSSGLPTTKKAKSSMGANYQNELDTLPVEVLLERMTEAIENNEWERRHQLIGATIALHSVRDAARDPKIQQVALDGGVSRSEVMVWMEESTKYDEWVQQMLTKMEARSYQAAVTKCLLKAGYTRTGNSGRYIKWYLPKDIPIVATSNKSNSNSNKEESKTEDEKEEAGDEEDANEEGQEQEDAEEGEEEDEEEGGDEEDGDEGEEEENEEEEENVDDQEKPSGDEDEMEEDSGSELGRTGDAAAASDGDAEEEEEGDGLVL